MTAIVVTAARETWELKNADVSKDVVNVSLKNMLKTNHEISDSQAPIPHLSRILML